MANVLAANGQAKDCMILDVFLVNREISIWLENDTYFVLYSIQNAGLPFH